MATSSSQMSADEASARKNIEALYGITDPALQTQFIKDFAAAASQPGFQSVAPTGNAYALTPTQIFEQALAADKTKSNALMNKFATGEGAADNPFLGQFNSVNQAAGATNITPLTATELYNKLYPTVSQPKTNAIGGYFDPNQFRSISESSDTEGYTHLVTPQGEYVVNPVNHKVVSFTPVQNISAVGTPGYTIRDIPTADLTNMLRGQTLPTGAYFDPQQTPIIGSPTTAYGTTQIPTANGTYAVDAKTGVITAFVPNRGGVVSTPTTPTTPAPTTTTAAAPTTTTDAATTPKSLLASTPTPTPTPTTPAASTLDFASSKTGGAVGQATGQATASQINQLATQYPDLVKALQNGSAALTYDDLGVPQLFDKTTGQPLSGYEYVQTRPDGNLQVNFSDGKGGYVSAVTTLSPEGTLAPVNASNVYSATKAAPDTGGVINVKNIIAVGLAYALPIIGEAIAAELAVSSSVGTALAAIGTGVAQGKTIEDSIKSAGPALIGANIMSEIDLSNLSGLIATDPSLKNVIENIANSTTQTALKGGGIKDIVKNAVATGGGTLLGQSLTPDLGTYNASILGQGLATGAVTGSTLAGLTAGAGTAGGLQATQNAYNRDIESVLNAQATGATPQKVALDFVDLSQGTQVAGPGGFPNDGFKPGQMTQTATGLFATIKLSDGTIVNVPVQYNQGSNSLTTNSTNPEVVNQVKLLKITPENITKINPVFLDKTPINPNITSDEQAALNKVASAKDNMINALKSGKSIDEYYNTYSYNQSLGEFANQIAEELAKDPTGTDPSYKNLRDEYQKITGKSFIPGTPVTDLGEIIVTGKVIRSDPTTNTSTIQTPDGVTINVSSVLPKDSSVSVNKTTSEVIPTSVTNQTAKTDTSPVSTTDTTTAPTTGISTGNVTITSGGVNKASNISSNITPNISSNVTSNITQDIINLLSSGTDTTTGTSTKTDTKTDTKTGTPTPTTTTTTTQKPGGPTPPSVVIPGTGERKTDKTDKTTLPTGNVTITNGGKTDNNVSVNTSFIPTNVSGNVSDNNVSITTSYVPPSKAKSLYPTIVGQFASPVTQAVSAYRPPGEIEGPETGKEKEPVWNTESLRNALGI